MGIKQPKFNKINEELPVSKNKNGSILFRFLNYSSYSLSEISKLFGKEHKSYIAFLRDLEKFIYDYTKMNYLDARKLYSSHKNGKKIKLADNKKIKAIVQTLPKEVIDTLELDPDLITHMHLKPNGNGKGIIVGIENGSDFYVIAVDPFHDLL